LLAAEQGNYDHLPQRRDRQQWSDHLHTRNPLIDHNKSCTGALHKLKIGINACLIDQRFERLVVKRVQGLPPGSIGSSTQKLVVD